MTLSRPWLALVVAVFCLPLFVGLDRTDLQDDEAIYAFGVDRILEIGDWLLPKSSPHEADAFLEKPPLKFWIVAAPIRLGLLPHTEFGIRFWDALFGGIAFVYVFAIGSRLAGPVCGAVAVLILFVHRPLLFEHGLRSNNMEAALLLSYSGGVYHFLAWAWAAPRRRGAQTGRFADPGRPHTAAVGLYFVLGFMCKFVAALFLPLILGVASLMVPAYRARLRREWRVWVAVAALVVALIAPWFVYAHLRFGSYFWQVILGEHVYQRFSTYLDPTHVHPWYYYPYEMYQVLAGGRAEMVVIAGLTLLLVQTIRRRSGEGFVILLWLALPLFLISLGTSKLYHYAYPFLPPLGLGAGYLAALVLALAPVPIVRALAWFDDYTVRRWPGLVEVFHRRAVRGPLLAVAATAVGIAVITLVYGPIRIDLGEWAAFRSSGVARPAAIAMVFGVLAGAGRAATRVVVPLVVAGLLPLPAYRATLSGLDVVRRPTRTSLDCVMRVQAAGAGRGLYLDLPDHAISHPMYYYFRRLRPWTRAETPSHAEIARRLYKPSEWLPMLVWERTYQDFRKGPDIPGVPALIRQTSPPMVTLNDSLLILPGPYAVCADEANQRHPR